MAYRPLWTVLLIGLVLAARAGEWRQVEGKWFQLKVPENWQTAQVRHGLEATSPDGAGWFLALERRRFTLTPRGCLREAARRWAPLSPVLTLTRSGSREGPAGFHWRIASGELAAKREGEAVRLRLVCGVLPLPGQHVSVVRGDYLPLDDQARAARLIAASRASLRLRDPDVFSGLDPRDLPDL